MIKIFLTLSAVSASLFSMAQEKIDNSAMNHPIKDNVSFDDAVPFAVLGLFLLIGYFILKAVKLFLDTRLKNKIIDKGVSEQLAISILQKNSDDNKTEAIKWFFLLFGIGLGFFIISNQSSLSLGSAAIMAFCLAASFMGYYLYLRYSKK